jgi:hypothetical protein
MVKYQMRDPNEISEMIQCYTDSLVGSPRTDAEAKNEIKKLDPY